MNIKERIQKQVNANEQLKKQDTDAKMLAEQLALATYNKMIGEITDGYLGYAMSIFESGWKGSVNVSTSSTSFPLCMKSEHVIAMNFAKVEGRYYYREIRNLPFSYRRKTMLNLKQAFIDAGFKVEGYDYSFDVSIPN